MWANAVCLANEWVRLEPIAERHAAGLKKAAAAPEIWPYMLIDAAQDFDSWWTAALASHAAATDRHFVVLTTDDSPHVVGSTRYMNLAEEHNRLEIGNTWYAPAVWGGPVNPACKLLLLTYAFEQVGVNRVEFRCDRRNARSRAALRKLGATEEGVLRQHMIVRDGFVRDTVQFGMVRADWPAVKAELSRRLARFGDDS